MIPLSDQPWRSLVDAHLASASKPLIVVLGPTASGKTDWSLSIAKHAKGEVVNSDSRQVYRDLTIGTAKILPEEMDGVPHHLLDVLDPKEELTIADYQKMATEVIDRLHGQGKVPVLVGGSMLYISAVIDGLEPMPKIETVVRREVEREYDADGGVALYAELEKIDPATAAAFHPNNKPYVVRAMEVYRSSGSIPSSLKAKQASPYDVLLLGAYMDRQQLVERIEKRADVLLKAGWVEEVQGLLDRGYAPEDPALKSHGYREICAALQHHGGDIEAIQNDADLREQICIKTRQYAKRQMTWWSPDERIHWFDLPSRV